MTKKRQPWKFREGYLFLAEDTADAKAPGEELFWHFQRTKRKQCGWANRTYVWVTRRRERGRKRREGERERKREEGGGGKERGKREGREKKKEKVRDKRRRKREWERVTKTETDTEKFFQEQWEAIWRFWAGHWHGLDVLRESGLSVVQVAGDGDVDYVSGSGNEEKWKLKEELEELAHWLDVKGERTKGIKDNS